LSAIRPAPLPVRYKLKESKLWLRFILLLTLFVLIVLASPWSPVGP